MSERVGSDGTPRPDQALILAIDLGTTSLKIGLVTVSGRVLRHVEHDLETTVLPDGGVVQDADRWWSLILATVADGVAQGIDAPVRAVALTGQWASTVPVSVDGTPVGPCVMWLDSRGGELARRRVGGPVAGYDPRHLLTWVRRTGGAPALDGADPLGHRWYLAEHEPAVRQAARWFLEPMDYLGLRLTGRAAATQASMICSWLTDNRRLDPGGYDPVLVRRSGVDPATLPPLLPNGSVLGPLRADVAARLGLDPRTPVVCGLGDIFATALASSGADLYDAHLSVGTTSWISAWFLRSGPTCSASSPRCPAPCPAATWCSTTTRRRAVACTGCGVSSTVRTRRRPTPTWTGWRRPPSQAPAA